MVQVNYKCIEPIQLPDSAGNMKYDRYFKIDFIFKNCGPSSLQPFRILVSFNDDAEVIKCLVGDRKIQVQHSRNKLTISKEILSKKESLNIDCFVARFNKDSRACIRINSTTVNTRRNRFLNVKRRQNRLLRASQRFGKTLWGFVSRNTLEVIFGLVLTSLITVLSIKLGVKADEKHQLSNPTEDSILNPRQLSDSLNRRPKEP